MAARQDDCANRKGACERRHHDHKTHCYALDLLPDEGHWISRPQQVGRHSVITKNIAEFKHRGWMLVLMIRNQQNHTVGNFT